MNKNILIFKIIFPAIFLSALGVLTNCDSRADGSTAIDNINNKFGNASLLPGKTPVGTANKIETLPIDLSKIPTVTYCELVSNAGKYDHKIVRLRAIYFTGFEKTYFYDSRCETGIAPEASEKIPAETWAQWDKSLISKGDSDEAKMNRRLNGFGRKDVTIVGKFNSTDERRDATQPNLFGHMNCCRFQFLIMRAEAVVNLDGKTAEAVNGYGKTVKFAPDQKLEFADFTLEFYGDVQFFVSMPQPRKKLPKYAFRVSRADKSLTVPGGDEGDNTPLEFEFGGANYQLESGISDASGRLAKDELIVRKTN